MQAANDILEGKREDYANMKKERYNMKKKKYGCHLTLCSKLRFKEDKQ